MSDTPARVSARRRLLAHPQLLVLYVLVYWGRTLFVLLALASTTLWFAGDASTRIVLLVNALALAVAFFNLGLTVGETGPPPGKRR